MCVRASKITLHLFTVEKAQQPTGEMKENTILTGRICDLKAQVEALKQQDELHHLARELSHQQHALALNLSEV